MLAKTLDNSLEIWKLGSLDVDAHGLYAESSLLFNYSLLFNSITDLQVGKKYINLINLVMRVLKKVHQGREKIHSHGRKQCTRLASQG